MDYCGKCVTFWIKSWTVKTSSQQKQEFSQALLLFLPTQDFLNSRIRLNKPKGKTGCHSSETLSSLYSLTN